MKAEEFYRLRDDRTSLYLGGGHYADKRVSIAIDARAAEHFPSQFAFLLAVNLTARWCRWMRVVGPTCPLDRRLRGLFREPPATLVEAGVALARLADPFAVVERTGVPDSSELALQIGGPRGPSGSCRVAGAGWMALVGDAIREVSDDENPIGSALAACIGAAYLFKAALGVGERPEWARVSLWNFRGGDSATDGPRFSGGEMGTVLLVGCGAVGSALAYCLPVFGLRGLFTVIDGDVVDISNLNRSPLFTYGDVGVGKSAVVADYLTRSGLACSPLSKWFDQAVSDREAFQKRPDLVIPAANDHGVRHAVQHQVPPLQVYGTTGPNWQAFLGRHIPLKEDCLACRFPTSAPQTPAMRCSMGGVATVTRTATPSPDAALPFLSVGAAVLASAEIARLMVGTAPDVGNFACLDFRGSPEQILTTQLRSRPACVCAAQSAVWRRLNGSTRFAGLSVGRQ